MNRRPFTMIEIVAAMAIIMILLTMVMGGAGVANRMAKESRTRGQIGSVETALEQYRVYWGFYPEEPGSPGGNEKAITKEWFDSIATDKTILDNTEVGFVEDTTYGYIDPYGEPYYYDNPGTMNPDKFDLWSKGRDTKHGDSGSSAADAQQVGAKDSDDVTNWGRD